MRMIYNVIDQILEQIPEDIPGTQGVTHGYAELRLRLEQLRNATLYKAPEQMPEYFQQVSNLLEYYLGEPKTDWQKKIQKIFAGRA